MSLALRLDFRMMRALGAWMVPFWMMGLALVWWVEAGARAAEPAPIRIRVRVGQELKGVRIRGFDLRWFGASVSPRRWDQMTEWGLRCPGRRVEAVQVGGVAKFHAPGRLRVDTPAGFLHWEGRPFRESLTVIADGRGHCQVVNHLDLEKYLDGLVNSEFSSAWAEGAVEAQIIAARTYALHQIREAVGKPGRMFDVESSVRDQVYEGSAKEDWRASRLVERTRGLVLAVKHGGRNEPLKAFYHSTCGGTTELPQKVWGRGFPGFRKRVACPYCRVSPKFQWSWEAKAGDLQKLAPQADPASIRLLVSSVDPEGRATRLVLSCIEKGRTRDRQVSPVEFRNRVGSTTVLSARFRVQELEGGGVRLDGRGYGHGVGLCQWGAKVMGEQGKAAEEILRHYYPAAEIRKLW